MTAFDAPLSMFAVPHEDDDAGRHSDLIFSWKEDEKGEVPENLLAEEEW